ncbi:UNVERIFIED_CONTAM: hypothetical protein GTU68_038165 [Idotea baltica]|nr:hypothetical protein [Idotea baltica]
MAQRTDVPVVAGPDRNADVEFLVSNTDVNIVISDDGLQHYRLKRDIEIVLIDGERQLGNQRCLPAGPLREPVSRLAECDFVIVNEQSPQAQYSMKLLAESAKGLISQELLPLSEWCGREVHAVTGIGNPQRFFTLLKSLGIIIIEHSFPDHHAFSQVDVDFGDELPVMMTEKDAVKCKAFAQSFHWVVPVTAKVSGPLFSELLEKIIQEDA